MIPIGRGTEFASGSGQPSLARIVENLPTVVILLDPGGRITELNQAAVSFLCVPRQHAIGKHLTDLGRFPDSMSLTAQFRALLSDVGHEPIATHLLTHAAAGRVATLDGTVARMHEDDGRHAGFVLSGTDVSDRVHALASLRLSEHRFREAARIGGLGSILWDLRANTLELSLETRAILGLPLDRASSSAEEFLSLVHPDDAARVEQSLGRAAAGIAKHDLEHRVVRPEGSVAYIRAAAELERDADGRPARLAGTLIDLTDITLAGLRLEALVASLREAQRIGRLGNWDWDIRTDALVWSDEIYRIFGWEPQSFPPTYPGFLEAVHPEDRPLVVNAVEVSLRSEHAYSIEHRIVQPGGQVRIVYESGEVHRDAAGQPIRMLGTVMDVTERRLAEDEVRRLNAHLEADVIQRTAELEVANRELETFAYSVSHDLRAPLRAIDGFAQALEEDFGHHVGTVGRDYLMRVRSAAVRMERMIDGVLRLSRATRLPVRRERVDLSGIARDVALELMTQEMPRTVAVTIAPDMVVTGDPELLRMVVANLLDNAWKFTRAQPAPEVTVGFEVTESERVFFIRDNGVGFDMVQAERLFTPFQRLHPGAAFEGHGIGLATVKRLVTRHGGRVWATSASGEGATFSVALPEGADRR